MTKTVGWLIIAALLLVALSVVSAANKFANVGRYQMVQRENNLMVLVDTKTGRCWESNPERNWVELPRVPVD